MNCNFSLFTLNFKLKFSQAGFIHFTRRTLAIVLIVAIVVPGTGLFYLFNFAHKADAAWFDDSWSYRQRIDVTNAGTAQTDYQVSITLDTNTLYDAGKLQADCDDIRITDINGKLLPYWIEQMATACGDGNSAQTIWVKVPSVSTTGNVLYAYYGNPSASIYSDGNRVFEFFDDFSGSAINTAKWTTGTIGATSGTNWSVSGGNLNGGNTNRYIQSVGTFTGDYTAQARSYTTTSGANGQTTIGFWASTSNSFGILDHNATSYYRNDSTWVNFALNGTSQWTKNITKVAGTTATYTRTGETSGSATATGITNSGISNEYVRLGARYDSSAYDQNFVATWDWVFVRKTATTEPSSAAPTNEEKSTGPIGYWKFDEGQGVVANNSQFKAGSSTMTNMNTNPTFETGSTTGWTLTGSYAASTEKSAFGSYSLKFSGTNHNGSADGPCVVASATTAYIWSAYAYKVSSGASGNFTFDILEYSGASCTTNIVDSSNTSIPQTDVWTRVSGSFTSNVSTVSMKIRAVNDGNSTGTAYYDGFQIESGSLANNYCDGTLTGNGTHAWTGTANASSSTCTNGTDGMLNGATWQSEDLCISGKCLYFNGASRVTVGTSTSGVRSISFWVKPTSVATVGLIDLDGGTSKISVSSGTISTAGFTSATIYVNGAVSSVLTANVWQYVTVTSTADITASAIKIGYNNTSYLNGFMDEVKFYNYALTAAQVSASYNTVSGREGMAVKLGKGNPDGSSLSNGLVGYWKMDESSSTAADSSGNALTLTNNGTTTYGVGKFGNASTYNGTTQYLSTATTISGVKTVAFWVNPASSTNNYINLITGTAYITSSSGTITATGFTSSSIYVNGVLNGTITASVWNHVVITTDTSIAANAFETGRANGSYLSSTSKLDDVRLYNRALSNTDVSTVYNFAPGPIAYYDLNAGSGTAILDKSGSGLVGIAAGTPAWISGKYGKALDFDGTNDVVTVNDNSIIKPKEITVSYWMKLDAQVAFGVPIMKTSSSSWNDGYGFYNRGASSEFTWWVNNYASGTQYVTITVPSVGAWHYITGTFDTTNGAKLYVDGVLKGSAAGTTAITHSTTSLSIGYHTGGNYMDGQLDDIKIYNYARSSKQIIEDMNASHPAVGSPIASALLHYKFDEGSANTCSGGSNDACNSGNVGSAIDGAFSGNTSYSQAGKFNRGAAFDGTTDFISIPTNAGFNFGSGGLTYSTWAEVDNFSINRFILDRTTGTIPLIDLIITTSATVTCQVRDTASTLQSITSTRTLSANTWYHLACVRDTALDKWIVYINGVPDISSTDTTALMDLSAVALKIGDHADGVNGMLGTIDEFKIYNYALTASEIKLDMNRGQAQVLGSLSDNTTYEKNAANQEYCVPGDSTSCAAPVGRWDFNEASGTTANDSSGNANTGTLTSGPTWTSGKVGKAVSLDGIDDYVLSSNATSVQLTTGTVEAWVKTSNAGASYRGVVAKENAYGMLIKDNVFITYDWTAVADRSTGVNVADGNWHHLVMSFQSGVSSGTILYVDGVPKLTTTMTVSSQTVALKIGTNSTQYFAGNIDQTMLFNYVRTPAQIAWDYNKGLPIAHFKLDECQGSVANDASGNSNTGTITIGATGTYTSAGTCASSSASSAWYNGASGKRNYSLAFDGTDDYIGAGTGGGASSAVTVSAWMYPTANNIMIIIAKTNAAASSRNYQLATLTNTELQFCVTAASCTSSSGFAWALNTWALVTVTYDGANIKFYKNGVLMNTQANATGIALTTDPLTIGAYGTGTGGWFTGKIDDARVYNYALTANQIQTLYSGNAIRYGPASGAP